MDRWKARQRDSEIARQLNSQTARQVGIDIDTDADMTYIFFAHGCVCACPSLGQLFLTCVRQLHSFFTQIKKICACVSCIHMFLKMQCQRRELAGFKFVSARLLVHSAWCVRWFPLLPFITFIIDTKQVASLLQGLCNFCSQVLVPSINHTNVASPV